MILAMILWEDLASNAMGAHLYIEVPYFWTNVFTFKAKPRKNLSNWRYLLFVSCPRTSLSKSVFFLLSGSLECPGSFSDFLCQHFSQWIGRLEGIQARYVHHIVIDLEHCPPWRCSHLTQRMASFQVSVKLHFLKVMKGFGICTGRDR